MEGNGIELMTCLDTNGCKDSQLIFLSILAIRRFSRRFTLLYSFFLLFCLVDSAGALFTGSSGRCGITASPPALHVFGTATEVASMSKGSFSAACEGVRFVRCDGRYECTVDEPLREIFA